MVKFLVIFLLPFIITKEKAFSLTDSILQWASKHNITISSKLTPEFLSVNHKKFRANSDITINETILSIPFDSIITPSKLLSLSTKKLKEIFPKSLYNKLIKVIHLETKKDINSIKQTIKYTKYLSQKTKDLLISYDLYPES